MMSPEMTTVSTTALRRNTQAILKLADSGPVVITRYGKPSFVLVSAAEFERIGGHNEYAKPKSEP